MKGLRSRPLYNKVAARKETKSKARTYEDGFLSRSSVAIKLGLKGFGSWSTVQKALAHAGYMEYDKSVNDYVTTKKAEGLCRMHVEFDATTCDKKTWMVWHPSIVEKIRDSVTYVKNNPVDTKTDRNYPEGFVSTAQLVAKLKQPAAVVFSHLILLGYAKENSKGQLEADDASDDDFRVWEETDLRGNNKSWILWASHIIEEVEKSINKGQK